jgi:alkanesulfonate monooxygenase SsuD/methylene tetrahydromethanopterin reductase-like flavin-dependent oxidoreductase (luciferase family)
MLGGHGAREVSGAREAVAAFEDQIRASCIVGTPEQVASRLRPSIEKIDSMGFEDTFVSVILAPPGTPAERAQEAVARFAGEVIPALRS